MILGWLGCLVLGCLGCLVLGWLARNIVRPLFEGFFIVEGKTFDFILLHLVSPERHFTLDLGRGGDLQVF